MLAVLTLSWCMVDLIWEATQNEVPDQIIEWFLHQHG